MSRSTGHLALKQRGMVLLLAMLFLLLTGMIAGTVMQTSIMQFRMAGNDQLREEAFQRAQALVTAIVKNPDNFFLEGPVGHRVCAQVDQSPNCDSNKRVNIAAGVAPVALGVVLDYAVERQAPLLLDSVPVRTLQRFSSSAIAYDAAVFEAHVTVDGQAVRQGRAELVQGIAVLIASSKQGRWE